LPPRQTLAQLARMREDDTKAATALVSFTIVQTSLIAFTQLPGNIEPQSGALVFRREKWLEDILNLLSRHARSVIKHFKHRQVTAFVTEQLEPYLRLLALVAAVAQSILH